MPYRGGGYDGLSGVGGVDYHQPAHDGSSDLYRLGENPNVPMTQNSDMERPGWTMTANYRIGWTDVGDWYNYTRSFPAGTYKVSIALSHDSVNEGALKGSLQRVVSAATAGNQTVQQLGVFSAPGSGGWGLNNLVPLRDGAGKRVELILNGLSTLRYTAESGDIDYILFEPLLPPQIVQQPQSRSVTESQPVEFTVAIAGDDSVTYQWQSNQVNVAGATGSTYALLFAPISANGARFRCVVSNSQGTVTSSEAVLTVTSEAIPPTLVRAYNAGLNSVVVQFSEPLEPASASAHANYRVSGGVTVSGATLGADRTSVTLATSPLTYRSSYVVTVSNVRDASGAGNMIAANSTVSFVAQDYVSADIGGSGQTVAAAEGGYDVSARGAAIGDTSDAFHFGYEQKTGNFDMRVRIAGITITDAFMQAGLMARENLEGNSRFAGAFASSPQIGAFFEARPSAGVRATNAAPNGGFPANYPHMWLRLQRSGNLFTAFASLEGERWTVLGANTLILPNTLYFGLAVSSGTTNRSTAVEFRDLGEVTSGSVGPLEYPRERLGPSSRRTGLAISEIMYYPAPRGDGQELEFVEIYNGGPIFEDLSGMTLSGAVSYTFPEGSKLEAGAFAVVAKAPADIEAVYRLSGVFGPFGGSLENEGGVVRLSDERGHTLLEANFSDARDWPAAADGAGSSLVLARPSWGERDVQAWEASTFVGGSPGSTDPVVPAPEANVKINEFLAHSDFPQVDFVELYNRSNLEADLSGCWLSDERGTGKLQIPANTLIAPRGYLTFDETVLGFALSAEGEAIYLVSSNRTRVIDAFKFGAQENGVSSGRWPDGAREIRRLESITQGAPNSRWRNNAVVINEIMYAPISGDSDDEYVELYNNGSQAVSLADWRLSGGIDFRFPPGASIPAGGYVVVGKNAARLRGNYSQLTVNNSFGDYEGSLKNSGERIALHMPDQLLSTNQFEQVITNRIYIEISEVGYVDGGRWPGSADGGGSSLELIDSRGDTTQPDNWRESDETAKGAWNTVEWTGVLDHGHSTYNPVNQLQITLQGAGECLVDAVEVLKGGINYIASNWDFENGATGWTFQGNHSGSTVVSSGAFQGSRALHIRAPGRGDTGINRIRTALTVNTTTGQMLRPGDTVTIRAKVKWLKGWPEILLRLRGNWLECAGRMTVPKNLGTPGLANSRRVSNAGPAIYDVAHYPPVPNSAQSVVVTARVSDPDGFGTLNVRYRQDPSTTVQTLSMRDDGTFGDSVGGDGIYTATIGGRSGGTLVAFRVEAADGSGASTVFPKDAPNRECLIRWGDQVRFGSLATYLMWLTSAAQNSWNSSDDKDNTYRDVTFVYNNDRVVYNAGVKDKGSPFHGGGGDAFLVMPEDQKVLGATDFAMCSTGNGGNEPTGQREQIIFWIARKMGANYLNRRSVHFIHNGSPFRGRNIMEDAEEPNSDYSQASVPAADDGDLYKIEDWFEFDDSAGSFQNTDANLEVKTTTDGSYKLARYRWMWRKRAVEDSANNYTNLFELVNAANNVGGGDYVSRVDSLVNVRGWMAVFALQRIAGNWDSYGFNRGKNAYIYKGNGAKWEMFPWDIDFVLGNGSNGPGDPLWGGIEPVVNRMFNTLAFRRLLWQVYHEAITGPLLPENYLPQIDGRYRVFRENNVSVGLPGDIATYINARRSKIANDLNGANTSSLTITSNGGNEMTTANPTLNLTGRAPIQVYTIEINGVAYPASWSSVTDWNVTIPLVAARSTLNVVGKDRQGNVIAGLSNSITINFTGTLHPPEGNLVINEIMYNPALPGASFLELYNRSTAASFDLSGYRINGIGYTFPSGALMTPGSYFVLAQNLAGFASAYGPSVSAFAEYPGSLDNGGEWLKLLRPTGGPELETLVDEVRYGDSSPWPGAADGFGPSLQLIDAGQDNWPAGNWLATATNAANRATPGAANSGIRQLAAFPKIYINEVLPNNIAGVADRFGEREPWIECVNAGTSAADLSGLYLSDSYTNLTKWKFPAGTSLQPGEYLLVWADGEANEGTATELHASFRLPSSSGRLALSRLQNDQPAVIDFVNYDAIGSGRSFGSYPDGQPQGRRLFDYPTAKAANNPASIAVQVFINEWMAGNNRVLDPADGDFDDWFELYNAGSTAVDLSGYFLTDNLTNATKYLIPNGKLIPGKGYLLVWADEETGQNAAGPDVHANFKLALAGEQIGLFAPDGTVVDALTFEAQRDGMSEGRVSDGETPPFVAFESASPGAPNVIASGNRPPVLGAIGNKTTGEEELLTFQVQADDPDAGQTVTYSLVTELPGAAMTSNSGIFTWTPSEAQGPGSYTVTIHAADNGTPPRSTQETIRIDVTEVNRAPVLAPIPDQSVSEGTALTLNAGASDPDRPENSLIYSIEPGAPAGLQIQAATGQISWVPQEADGPGDYAVTVRVRDNGTPEMSATRQLRVRVNEANNPPALELIASQTIDEGETFAVTARATDPDNPPAAMSYSLEGIVPPGARIDSASGVVTWPTTEVHGPSTNFFTVRATENSGERLSDSQSFTVIVREVNEAPSLTSPGDRKLSDGSLLTLTWQARDNDIPAQTLTYEILSGGPAGMSIDARSGAIAWHVPLDHPDSTNLVVVRVTDSGPGNLSATNSFRVMVKPGIRVVINEIMHSPSVAGSEYVEVLNTSAVNSWNLSGWRLEGRSMNFTFSENSVLGPGAFLLAVNNRITFQSAFGSGKPVAGEWSGRLQKTNETLRLIRPEADGESVIDAVSFSSEAPWPNTSGGTALQLVDALQDNNRLGNWKAAAGYNGPTNLLAMTSSWKYNQAGVELGTSWRSLSYEDRAWPAGAGLLYVEGSALPAPKSTLLTLGRTTYYFRASFNLPAKPEGAQLLLSHVIDDGAVFYLNGVELHRVNMPAGTVAYATFADGVVDNAALTGPVTLSGDRLVAGENVLAVEVHQVNAGSSDIVFGCSLNISGGQVAGATPGLPNSVAATVAPFEMIYANEVLANNSSGAMDSAGEREPWLELYNSGTTAVNLSGMYLSPDMTELTRWRFPAGAALAPGEFKVVWLDGESAETLGPEWHANFRVSASGLVLLSRDQDGQPVVLDYLKYATSLPDVSFGAMPDGQPNDRASMTPSPGAPNKQLAVNRPPEIPSIGSASVEEGATIAFPIEASDPDGPVQALTYRLENAPEGATVNPATGAFRWATTEADGPGTNVIRVIVTDNGIPPLSATNQFTVRVLEVNTAPAFAAVGPQTGAVGTLLSVHLQVSDGDLPGQRMKFAIAQGLETGASIDPEGVFSWAPGFAHAGLISEFVIRVVDDGLPPMEDTVSFTVNVPQVVIEAPVVDARILGANCVLTWSTEPGRRYRVLRTEDIATAGWRAVVELEAVGAVSSFTDGAAGATRQFYRIEVLP